MQKRSAAAGLVLGAILGAGVPAIASSSAHHHQASTQQTPQTKAERLQWYENRFSALDGLARQWDSMDATCPVPTDKCTPPTLRTKIAAQELLAAMHGS